jgi:predicted nucleic acid-binding protein
MNRRDEHHAAANQLVARVDKAKELWTTTAVLIEIGNGLSRLNRPRAVEIIRRCFQSPGHIHVVEVDADLLLRAVQLYESRSDKD